MSNVFFPVDMEIPCQCMQRKWTRITMKPEQQANGKRRFKFTKASQAQLSRAKRSQEQTSTAKHSPARPSLSFRSLFGRVLRLHGSLYRFALFSAACFACTALVFFSLFSRVSWGLLGHFLPLLGLSWALLGRSWAPLGPLLGALGGLLGLSWPLLGRSWNDT